jgi:hypothetical protein
MNIELRDASIFERDSHGLSIVAELNKLLPADLRAIACLKVPQLAIDGALLLQI